MELSGQSRTSYYRHVRSMMDYMSRPRAAVSVLHDDLLRAVALRRPEAGHRRVRAYAIAWGELTPKTPGGSRMSCYRRLKANGLLQSGRPGVELREIRERRRQMLAIPREINQVLQGDFTDYETEDGSRYHIGGITEYLSRFNLVSKVLDTETAEDLIQVTEMALREVVDLGHRLPGQITLVTDNGPAMKSRRFRNFVKKSHLLIHIRGQKYHPQTIGREERYHGSLKMEHLYRVLPQNKAELESEVAKFRHFYNYERLHMSLGYRPPAAVYLSNQAEKSSYLSAG
jgi:putative transposase